MVLLLVLRRMGRNSGGGGLVMRRETQCMMAGSDYSCSVSPLFLFLVSNIMARWVYLRRFFLVSSLFLFFFFLLG